MYSDINFDSTVIAVSQYLKRISAYALWDLGL